MPKICYTPKKFTAEHQQVIDRANSIVTSYADRGYDLTLRQIYYQFVSRGWLTNTVQSYKRLGGIISDARRAGLIDWKSIVDRTRFVREPNMWRDPSHLVRLCAAQFDIDWWDDQSYRPEVWIEKDALVGVLEVACAPWHCPFFSCRGYGSDSELWAAAQRLDATINRGQIPVIFHLGDHDPSGIDMSRDIFDRIKLFSGAGATIEVRRIALTMEQVEEIKPPPNPAKETDARFVGYQAIYGDESWELDALNPEYITDLIAKHMEAIVEPDAWATAEETRDEGRRLLKAVADRWDKLTAKL